MSWVSELEGDFADEKDIDALLQHPTTRDARCHAIMQYLVEEAAEYSGDWKDSFVSIDWRKVENYQLPDNVPLAEVLHDTVNFVLTDHDAKILTSGYQTRLHKFDYKSFLRDFFMGLQRFEDNDVHSLQTETGGDGSGKGLWKSVRKKLCPKVSVANAFAAGAVEKARQRALQHLIDAIGRIQVSRFSEKAVHFTGSLDKFEFRSELRRVFGIHLSMIESDSLFEAFDIDGNGNLSSLEFNTSFNQMLVEWRRRDGIQARERKKVEARTRRRKQTNRAQQCQKMATPIDVGFSQSAYERAVVKLSEAILALSRSGERIVLSIPDGYVSECFVQRTLREQWGARLSREEVHSLCAKLLGHPPSSSGQTALPAILPQRVSRNEEVGDVILGKLVKTLIVNLKSFVCPKKKRSGKRQHRQREEEEREVC